MFIVTDASCVLLELWEGGEGLHFVSYFSCFLSFQLFSVSPFWASCFAPADIVHKSGNRQVHVDAEKKFLNVSVQIAKCIYKSGYKSETKCGKLQGFKLECEIWDVRFPLDKLSGGTLGLQTNRFLAHTPIISYKWSLNISGFSGLQFPFHQSKT